MKVISGKYKGRLLKGHDLKGTRPTMDRVKESLFASIQDFVKESTVLDLFAGSGNLGIEALSMKAENVCFVDKNNLAYKTILENIKMLDIESNKVEVICKDYKSALKSFNEVGKTFDIIFLDPPYKTDYIEKSIELISKYDILNKNGLIICESDNLEKVIYKDMYSELKNKKYGDKYIVILQKNWYNEIERWC